jgi:hypothetical protein
VTVREYVPNVMFSQRRQRRNEHHDVRLAAFLDVPIAGRDVEQHRTERSEVERQVIAERSSRCNGHEAMQPFRDEVRIADADEAGVSSGRSRAVEAVRENPGNVRPVRDAENERLLRRQEFFEWRHLRCASAEDTIANSASDRRKTPEAEGFG